MKKVIIGLVTIGALVFAGCSGSSGSGLAKAPSGDNCGENVAYLQAGVDKYKEVLGNYPADVKQLLDQADGKGPFVEKVPECPSGNIYIIENGTVKEAPPGQ